jgi:hypothetical protein
MPVQGYYQGPPPSAPQPGYQGIPQQGYQGIPQQGYQGPPAGQQWQQPGPGGFAGQAQQQRPPATQGDLDLFFNQPSGGGRSIASFLHKQVGQSITGVVARPVTHADVTQQTDFTTGRGLEFRDGRPKWQMTVPLAVQESIEFPDGRATWYVRGSERDELAAAMGRAGAPAGPPEMGAIITITYVGDRNIPNLNAKKLHNIVYRRPDGSGVPPAPDGQQAQAPPAQPAPAAPQQPQPQYQQQEPQYQFRQDVQNAAQYGTYPVGPPGGYQQGPPPGVPQGYPQPAQQLPGQPPAPQQQGPPQGTPQSAAGQAVQNATQAAMATAGQYQQPQHAQPAPAGPPYQPGPPAPQAQAAPLPPGVSAEDVAGMNPEQLALISKLAAQQVNMQPQPQ